MKKLAAKCQILLTLSFTLSAPTLVMAEDELVEADFVDFSKYEELTKDSVLLPYDPISMLINPLRKELVTDLGRIDQQISETADPELEAKLKKERTSTIATLETTQKMILELSGKSTPALLICFQPGGIEMQTNVLTALFSKFPLVGKLASFAKTGAQLSVGGCIGWGQSVLTHRSNSFLLTLNAFVGPNLTFNKETVGGGESYFFMGIGIIVPFSVQKPAYSIGDLSGSFAGGALTRGDNAGSDRKGALVETSFYGRVSTKKLSWEALDRNYWNELGDYTPEYAIIFWHRGIGKKESNASLQVEGLYFLPLLTNDGSGFFN